MRSWGPVLGAAAALLATEVRADCALPAGYHVTEDPAGRVGVCLVNDPGRTCPDAGLLRRNVNSGDVVEITTCDGGCFVDECVPAGTYQYGLAQPYACQPASCYTAYYQEATVAGAAPGCTPTVAPPAAASTVPWGGQQNVCGYQPAGAGSSGCGLAPAGTVLGTNLALFLLGMVLWHWGAGRRARG